MLHSPRTWRAAPSGCPLNFGVGLDVGPDTGLVIGLGVALILSLILSLLLSPIYYCLTQVLPCCCCHYCCHYCCRCYDGMYGVGSGGRDGGGGGVWRECWIDGVRGAIPLSSTLLIGSADSMVVFVHQIILLSTPWAPHLARTYMVVYVSPTRSPNGHGISR